MPKQTFKDEEAKTWILSEGRKKWWINNHFRKIRLFTKGQNSHLWHIVYSPSEPRGGLEGKFIGEEWDQQTDQCDVFFNPTHVQKIEIETGRHTCETIPEIGECDVFMRMILPRFFVELKHIYFRKSFGRIGYSENLRVWYGFEIESNG
jgi:hypothetical protein